MNPFLINNYQGPEYFCDRKAETKILLSNIENNSNTAFFAQRRIGKTALIQHVFYQLKKKRKVECLYLDIYATQNLKAFIQQLASSIYAVFPENKSIGKRFFEAIKLLRPVIGVDQITGNPELSLDISQTKQLEKSIFQLLHFLDNQNIQVVIAIDEFQQILNYPEKNTEALLRTSIQQLKNVCFIFCGSHQKMMHQIFNNAKRPFYASTKNINLKRIPTDDYRVFIKEHFEASKIKINAEALAEILTFTDCHTYYTQRLCHELYALGSKKIDIGLVHKTFYQITSENESIYFQYRNLITSPQWNLLKAIAIEEKIIQPYAKDFIYTHKLGTPANVKRSLESLLEKEMIYYTSTVEAPYYEVYDKFLMRWLQNKK